MTRNIVHAGFHRTGTTSIQNFLSEHRVQLAEQRVHYPGDPFGSTGQHCYANWMRSNDPADWTPNCFFGTKAFASSKAAMNTIFNQQAFDCLLETELPLRILSSENFIHYTASELVQLERDIGPIDQIVVYHRDGIEFLYACWATLVAFADTVSFSDFLKSSLTWDYASPIRCLCDFLDHVVASLGPERLSVRSFAAGLSHPRGIIGDFVERAAGLSPIDVPNFETRANQTPTAAAVELQRAVNIVIGSDKTGKQQDLRARLQQLEPAFSRAAVSYLEPHLSSITIADAASPYLDAEGLFMLPSRNIGAGLAPEFRFHPEGSVRYLETDPLMALMYRYEPFRDLVG
jgi:hypothetical protein